MKKTLLLIVFIFLCLFSFVGCSFKENSSEENLKFDNIVANGVDVKINKLSNIIPTQYGFYDSYELVATVMPNNATNTTLIWNFEFENADYNSTRYYYDYIDVRISSDTLICLIEFSQPFDYPILLTVYSESNPFVNATCRIKCYERITAVTNVDCDLILNDVFYEVPMSSNSEFLFNECQDLPLDFSTYSAIFNSALSLNFLVEYNIFGTESTNIETIYQFRLSNEVLNTINSIGSLNNSGDRLQDFDNGISIYEMMQRSVDFTDFDNFISVFSYCIIWFDILVTSNVYVGEEIIQSKTDIFHLGGFDIYEVPITSLSLSSTDLLF